MNARFRCNDPFDTPGRVLDAARKMGLPLDAFSLYRAPDGDFALHVAAADADPERTRVFLDRVKCLVDLLPEDARA